MMPISRRFLRMVAGDLRRALQALSAGDACAALTAWGDARVVASLAFAHYGQSASLTRLQRIAENLRRSICAEVQAVPKARPLPIATAEDIAIVVRQIIETLNTREGYLIPERLLDERARNGAQAMLGAFEVRILPPVAGG
jgi:hypothetical protein